ncbi:MAG TPA: DUF4331 family protein [Flavobacteriaceae bacterium]|nr:DUF4331 family protein [Flavobacteriaceae bacterium]
MRNINKIIAIVCVTGLLFNCEVDEVPKGISNNPNLAGTYMQEDQMGRPAVNTVFVSAASKDMFNTTVPSDQGAAFQSMFEANLTGLSPAYANPGDTNALGLDAATFSGFLATDVLNVSLDGTTTFYDGTNVLTGRALADDVITVELLLIFGGEDFSENPGLSNDNVDANDKPFLASFPYLASPW